jgi:hypothetical protein
MAKTSAKEPKRPKMVDWYSPTQLAKTGALAAVSTLLGASLDNRKIIAYGGTRDDSVLDYSAADTFTFDYMADTGDGWDSTYTLAYLMSAPRITPADSEPLERPEIAIIGGDAVYPVASKQEYLDRLQSPFDAAPADIREGPDINRLPINDIFIVPGNHDWYDSLGSLSERFFAYHEAAEDDDDDDDDDESGDGDNDGQSQGRLVTRRLGQFRTKQVRSYFVLKMPHDWEIWAVDIQLGKNIDAEQFAFFADHTKTINENTRIILCTAEPTILSGSSVEEAKPALMFALRRIRGLAANRGAQVKVQLAGDTHNYQRYEVETEHKKKPNYTRQQFVCGGGGAFLHPTHSFNTGKDKSDPRIDPKMRYPDKETSKKLTWGNLKFVFKHPAMAVLFGIIYMLLFWETGLVDIDDYFLHSLGSATLFVVMVIGFTLFGKIKWLGLLHGVAHGALAVGVWWLAEELEWTPIPKLSETAHVRLFVLIVGGILAAILFGLYLIVALNVFRTHHNETFSALGSPHYKCFLRCTIESDKSLTVRSIGIPRTAGQTGQHPVPTMIIEQVDIPA